MRRERARLLACAAVATCGRCLTSAGAARKSWVVMQSLRLLIEGRRNRLLIAHRSLLLPSEAAEAVPMPEAGELLERLPDRAVRALVDAWGHRFPNDIDPQKTARVMTYVKERVGAGAVAVVKRG